MNESDPRQCLHCGRTKSQLRPGDSCATEGGYEYIEIIDEWPRHRWSDWKNEELARFGIKPEAYARYRRADESNFQWASCDDTMRGHRPSPKDDPEWGLREGDCTLCGRKRETFQAAQA